MMYLCAKKPFERLPASVKPKHYDISLMLNINSLTFEGKVSISIQVGTRTNEIVLNSADLELDDITLRGDAGDKQTPQTTEFLGEDEIVKFIFAKPITPGCYKLEMAFEGEIKYDTKGLYCCKYENEAGELINSLITNFESTNARRCFPCFDDPAMKATFAITLTTPKDLTVLSNMPVKSSKKMKDVMLTEFETTPVMSTYLVAFVVGEYDFIEDTSSDGVLVRVYTPIGRTNEARFALEVATKVLPFYKYYFKIAYPLPKIDLVAIPDFNTGAMENWGLIIYRELCLLIDPEEATIASKKWVALVVSHELAHQWFGNLVTMEWWTQLWLNEGYAQFSEHLCVDYMFPNYHIWNQFIVESYNSSLELDALKDAHPVEVPVGDPKEVDNIFDVLSYNKGASIIRMLHYYVGEENFRNGMTLYLTMHQYKNTCSEDLWSALEEVSKKPVGAVMSTWTKQKGFPVIQVALSPECGCRGSEGIVLQLTQAKFNVDGFKLSDTSLWKIPIAICSSKQSMEGHYQTLMESKHTKIHIPNVKSGDWIKLNPGTVGYYRVHYDSNLLERFIPVIRAQEISPVDRLGILNDLFALVKCGYAKTVEILKLLTAFDEEDDYNVWSAIGIILGKLSILLSHTTFEDDFNKFQKKIMEKVARRLGWERHPGETHLESLLRNVIIGRMAWLDDENTIKEARNRFESHITSGPPLPHDLRVASYRAVLRAGGQEEFEALLKLFKTTEDSDEKDRISRALCATKDVGLIQKTLEFSMSDEISPKDSLLVIMSLAITCEGRNLTWQYYKTNWRDFLTKFENAQLLSMLVKNVTEKYASEPMALEIETFFQKPDIPGGGKLVQQAVETIRLNAAWLDRDSGAIQTFLNPC